MTRFADFPYGFEDGHVVSYCAVQDQLTVVYEFWNERRLLLIFDDFLALHDDACIGVIIGEARDLCESDFMSRVLRLQFRIVPPDLRLAHYALCNVDDDVVFEVIAKDCRFMDVEVAEDGTCDE